MFKSEIHRRIYLLSLAFILCSLPLSVVGVSIGMIVLVVNFAISGNLGKKWFHMKKKPTVWVFVAIYPLMLISGLLSNNLNMGLEITRIWLPLLLIPIIVASSDELSRKEFFYLLIAFVLAVLFATLYGAYLYLIAEKIDDPRKLSPFISHIRMALIVCIAIAILLQHLWERNEAEFLPLFLAIALIIWFIGFLFMLKSFTGILMLALLVFTFTLKIIRRVAAPVRFAIYSGLGTVLFIALSYLAHQYGSFTSIRLTPDNLPRKATVLGNTYFNDTLSRETENGYFVNINICEDELKNQWQKRSHIPYHGTDYKGQPLRLTLFRYLASKGLTKDSLGASHLDSLDISLIERGFTNVLFRNGVSGFKSRLYEFFFELNKFRHTGQLTGGSILRRIHYNLAAWHVVKNNMLFGVGYGDLLDEMESYYSAHEVDLPPQYHFMPHNQYLTVWASAGIIALIIFLSSMLITFLSSANIKIPLVLFFWLMVLISMLFEDTLLTHIGVSLVAVFTSILIFGYRFKTDFVK